MEKVFLGLGGNKGDSLKLLTDAFGALSSFLKYTRISSFYRSAARYYEDQPDFLNAVVEGWTELEPRDLLREVNRVEADFGRERKLEIRKGPRSLDIDILLYGERLVVEPDLIIPHAGLRERKFALLPLVELESGLKDPATGETFLSILLSLPSQGIYLLNSSAYDRLYI